MNATFVTGNPELDDKFVKEAMELFGKELPKTVPAPSTIFDHMEKDEEKIIYLE